MLRGSRNVSRSVTSANGIADPTSALTRMIRDRASQNFEKAAKYVI